MKATFWAQLEAFPSHNGRQHYAHLCRRCTGHPKWSRRAFLWHTKRRTAAAYCIRLCTARPCDCARTQRRCRRKDVCCFGHQTCCVDVLSFHFCHASEQTRFVCHEVVCCFVGGTTHCVPRPDGAEARMRRNASCQGRRLDQSTLNSVGAVCHVSEIPTSKSRPWHSSFWDALHRQTGDQSIFRNPHRTSKQTQTAAKNERSWWFQQKSLESMANHVAESEMHSTTAYASSFCWHSWWEKNRNTPSGRQFLRAKHVASAEKNDRTDFEIERLPDTSYISFRCWCCPKQFDRAIAHIEIAANWNWENSQGQVTSASTWLSLFAVLGILVLCYGTFTQRVVVIPDRPKSSFDVENAEKIVKLQTSVEKPMVVTFDEIGIVTVRALGRKGTRVKKAPLQAFVWNSCLAVFIVAKRFLNDLRRFGQFLLQTDFLLSNFVFAITSWTSIFDGF